MYCNSFPCETTCRVWDLVFFYGVGAMLYVGLATCFLAREKLMNAGDAGEVLNILMEFERSLYDHDVLVSTAVSEV